MVLRQPFVQRRRHQHDRVRLERSEPFVDPSANLDDAIINRLYTLQATHIKRAPECSMLHYRSIRTEDQELRQLLSDGLLTHAPRPSR
jgi:hypothetical protein